MCIHCGKKVKHYVDVFCSLRCYDAAHEEYLERIWYETGHVGDKKGGDRQV